MADIEQREILELVVADMALATPRADGLVSQVLVFEWREKLVAALASQAQVPEDVRRAGAMLSNCAYNLAQRQHLTDDERRSLDEARRAWDAAMIAARDAEWAAIAAAPAREVSG